MNPDVASYSRLWYTEKLAVQHSPLHIVVTARLALSVLSFDGLQSFDQFLESCLVLRGKSFYVLENDGTRPVLSNPLDHCWKQAASVVLFSQIGPLRRPRLTGASSNHQICIGTILMKPRRANVPRKDPRIVVLPNEISEAFLLLCSKNQVVLNAHSLQSKGLAAQSRTSGDHPQPLLRHGRQKKLFQLLGKEELLIQ